MFTKLYYLQAVLWISPLVISSLISFGDLPSTWHPTLKAVPKISLTVPVRSFASDLKRIILAIAIISSSGIDLECLIFFSFFRSRGGSFKALITSEEAEGTTETAACRFCIVSFTVTRRPFLKKQMSQSNFWKEQLSNQVCTQSPVAFAISSPTFFGDRPRGPILGARADEAPTSPPVALSVLWLQTN